MLMGVRRLGGFATLAAAATGAFLIALVAASPAAVALKVDEIVTPKGIKAWLVEEHAVPLIAIKFAFTGGAMQDPPGKEGLGGLISDVLTEGAGDLPAAAFKEKASRLGTRLTASNGRDALYGGLEALSARLAPSAELLRLMLVSPRFDADAVERSRAQRLSDLAQSANEPTKISLERWYAEAFPGHAYGRVADGTAESVGRLTAADLKAQHKKLLARDVLKVVVVGDIDKAKAAEVIDLIFGDLPEKASVARIDKTEPKPRAEPLVIEKDYPLSTATFGLRSLPSDHPDFPALQVVNQVIGSGDFDSRLMEEVRVKRGLAYSIKTGLLRDSTTSFLLGGFQTKNEVMGTALGVVKDVLAATARDGPTQAQFDNAKRYLTGSYLLDFDTNAKVGNSLLQIWLEGKGPDYLLARNERISRVTLAEAKRVAGEVLRGDRLLVTIVGKPKMAP
jgi:zinc protease